MDEQLSAKNIGIQSSKGMCMIMKRRGDAVPQPLPSPEGRRPDESVREKRVSENGYKG